MKAPEDVVKSYLKKRFTSEKFIIDDVRTKDIFELSPPALAIIAENATSKKVLKEYVLSPKDPGKNKDRGKLERYLITQNRERQEAIKKEKPHEWSPQYKALHPELLKK